MVTSDGFDPGSWLSAQTRCPLSAQWPRFPHAKSAAKAPAEQVVTGIRRQARRRFSAKDKIRIVLAGVHGEDSIAEQCRKKGIAQSTWSKELMD